YEALLLLLLRAVTAPGLLTAAHTLGVQRAADDLVAHTGQVLHTTTAHEHDGVLLQVVAHAGDVGGDLDAVGELHTRDLAERGVRLLRGGGVHAGADAPTLRAAFQRRRLGLADAGAAALADQLLDGGDYFSVSNVCLLWCSGTVHWFRRGRRLRSTPRRPPRSGVSPPSGLAARPNREKWGSCSRPVGGDPPHALPGDRDRIRCARTRE